MKRLICDIDDTVIDWFAGFKRFVGRRLGVHVPAEYNYNFSEYLGVPEHQINALVTEFNASWEFGTLPPIANSEKVLPVLAEQFGGVSFISCCGKDDITTALRRANLYHVFGDIWKWDECHFLNHTDSKGPDLSRYRDDEVIWVEDNYLNALVGVQLGFRVFMIRRHHNVRLENNGTPQAGAIKWVNDWQDIMNDL